jgi:hypothetical protein
MKYNRVYVAGASSERNERAKPVIAALKAAGYEITHDWTVAVDYEENHPIDDDSQTTRLYDCAKDDYEGVRTADVFVLLAPQKLSTGAWFEFGVAFQAGRKNNIYIAGNIDKCIFAHLIQESHKWPDDESLVKAMIESIANDRFSET